MRSSFQLFEVVYTVLARPQAKFRKDARWGSRLSEGGGPHLYCVGAGSDQLRGRNPARYTTNSDDGQVRPRGSAVKDCAHGDGMDRRPRQAPSAPAEERTAARRVER
jgi:hypothetical protein